VNVLVDENLTPSMVQRLAAKGVAAAPVAHVGLSGATDPEVWKYAYEHDQIVVTTVVDLPPPWHPAARQAVCSTHHLRTTRGLRSRTNAATTRSSSSVPVATQPAVQSIQVESAPSHAARRSGP
jgi:uncharacterized protein DUF5615